jgi:hypothetical protein
LGTIDELTMAKEMRKISNNWVEALNLWESTNDVEHKKMADEQCTKLNELRRIAHQRQQTVMKTNQGEIDDEIKQEE